ncbi:hypothetical protein JCM5353_001510 [Sporobolomyces roseus]
MSIPKVPDDVLDSIFDYLDDASFYNERQPGSSISSAQHTFTILCLVSKRFLPLARSHLYCRPFPASLHADGSTASALLSSLVKQRGYLGTMVRSLNGLISYVLRLRVESNTSSAIPGIFVWYLSILRACPEVIELDLTFDHPDRLTRVLEVLQRPNPNLRIVNFANPYGGTRQPIPLTEELARTALQDPIFRRIEKLSLQSLESVELDLELDPDAVPPSYPPLDLLLRSLSINELYRKYPHPCPISLVNSSALTHFDLTISVDSVATLPLYLTPLPSTLEHMTINIVPKEELSSVSSYNARLSDEIRLPLDTFSRFTDLRSLALRHYTGPHLLLLHQIITSCTQLLRIDLKGCVWVGDDVERVAGRKREEYRYAVFPLADIHKELLSLQSLKRVHLGNVPAEEQILESLMKIKHSSDFELEWDVVSDPELRVV